MRDNLKGTALRVGIASTIFLSAMITFSQSSFSQEGVRLEYVSEQIVFVDSKNPGKAPYTFQPKTDSGAIYANGKPIFWVQAPRKKKIAEKLSLGEGKRQREANPQTTSAPPGFESATREQGNDSRQFLTSPPDAPQNVESPQESPTAQPDPETTPDPTAPEPVQDPEPSTPEPVVTPDPVITPDPIPPVPVTVPQLPVNHAPTVQSMTFDTSEDSTLRRTLSGTDEDNNQLTFIQLTNPLHGTLSMNSDGTFQYVPTLNYFGTDTFEYKASDGSLNSNPAIVSIDILAVNDLPLADAGIDQTVSSGSMVTLDGSQSIDLIEGSDLTYTWTQADGETVTLNNLESPTPTFTAPTGPLTLIFNLQVQDSENGVSQSDSVIITVEAPISQGTTYYIDQYHPSANDSNTGTSEDQPWKTLNSDLINALSPGDTVLIKGDASQVGVYTKTVQRVVPGSNFDYEGDSVITISNLHGEAGAEITIKNYPGHKITIDGVDEAGNWHVNVIRIEDSSYLRIEGLKLFRAFSPVLFMFRTSNSIIQDIYADGSDSSPVIIVIQQGNQNTIRHSTVTGGAYGINVIASLKNVIDENHIYGNQQRGIYLGGGGHSILRNVVHHNISDIGMGMGMWIESTSGGNLISENILYAHLNGIVTAVTEALSSGNVIRNNIAFNHSGQAYGYEVYGANSWPVLTGPFAHGDLFCNNVAAYQRSTGFHFMSMEIAGQTSASNPLILRNNIGIGEGSVEFRNTSSNYDSNFNLWDNITRIFYSAGNGEGSNSISGSAGFSNIGLLDIDTNNDGTPDVFDSLNDPEANFPDTEAAVNYAFAQARNIFSLTPSSQAIDHGAPITYTDPVTGNPVTIPYNGSAPDMGAFES